MDNKIFNQALNEALTTRFAAMLDIDDALLSHEFSNKYIKNRDKLIKRRSHSYYKLISTVGKRAACFIAVFFIAAFAAVFSIEAVRSAFLDFIMRIFPTHTVFESSQTENSPETIEDIYVITYDMSGFEIGFENYSEKSRIIDYINIEEEKMLSFEQSIKSDRNPHINTEDAILKEVKIGDIHAIYFLDNNGYNNYIWDNGDYIFNVYGNIDKTLIDKIILSVQKVE